MMVHIGTANPVLLLTRQAVGTSVGAQFIPRRTPMNRRRARRPLLLLLIVTLLVLAPPAALAKQPANGGSTASAWVFAPNPVASSGNQGLLDNKDADSAALDAQLRVVELTDLDGSGYLRGTWAVIVSETGDPAFETDGTYYYTRHDDRFEQVMGYYWTTQSQLYLRTLGFGTGTYPAVNADQQRVRINQWGVDNSFATDHPRDEMRFGKGGVDDAEDADVILHELGHQIHFSQGFAFASSEADAISEGFGDYWAATASAWTLGTLGLSLDPSIDPACIADWDSISYTSSVPHCLREVDLDLQYPTDLNGRIHHDGQIWSRALWDIRGALGNVTADQIILNGQWNFTGTTMTQLATATWNWAKLTYGELSAQAAAVFTAFDDRGIL